MTCAERLRHAGFRDTDLIFIVPPHILVTFQTAYGYPIKHADVYTSYVGIAP